MPDPTELRRLLDEATPTPWVAADGIEWNSRVFSASRPGYIDVADTGNRADADLIAAAVNALPELLDAAEALERVKALYERAFDEEHLQTVNRDDYAQGWEEGRDLLLSDLREAIDGEPQP